MFSDVSIIRTLDGTTPTQILKIPISYASKDKMLARITADPNINREFAIQVPTMSFDIVNYQYDASRKLNTLGKTVKRSTTANTATLSRQYNPVPYNFTFNLYIYCKNNEDGTMILEQILPFFTPDWSATVELVPQLGFSTDIPIIHTSISVDDQYTGDFTARKALIYTLSFTMKGYLFGPIKEQKVIKFANATFYIPNSAIVNIADAIGNTAPSDRVTVQPGLLANGSPTSNIALTIPYQQIESNTNFAYIVTTSGIILQE